MQPRTFRKHGERFHLTLALWASSFLALPATGATSARIFDAKDAQGSALFAYKMDISKEGKVEQWSATITDAQKQEYATEDTWMQEGKLVRYSLRQPQLAEEADVKRTPTGVVFRYFKDGKWKEDFETTSEEVITGPQIVSLILQRWDALVAGKTIKVRFAIPDRLETIGFRFKLEKTGQETTVFHFEPSTFFIRQLVSPVVLTYRSGDRKIVSMRGPTFLKKKKGDRWEDLQAEVRFE